MSFKQNLTQALGRSALKFKKVSPTVAVVGGVVGLGATVVLSSRATLKAQDIVVEHKNQIEVLDEAFKIGKDKKDENGEIVYSEEDYSKDHAKVWCRSAVAMLKLYGPAIIVGGISVAAIMGAHKSMGNRVASLTAAYGILENSFKQYRGTVREELGEELENEIYSNTMKGAVEADKEKALEAGTKKTNYSVHARFFDEFSTRWTRNPGENRIFLSNAQNHFNDILLSRGYVFLNEVYEHLGFDTTPEGQLLGWFFSGDEGSNNYIDFGIFQSEDWAHRAFVNGDEAVVLLDFNIDGPIWDQI